MSQPPPWDQGQPSHQDQPPEGDTVTGSVAFQVPNGMTVSNVKWTTLSGFGSTVEWIVHG